MQADGGNTMRHIPLAAAFLVAAAVPAGAQGNIAPPGNFGSPSNVLTILDTTATTATLSCTPGHYFVGNSPPVEVLLNNYTVKVSPIDPGANLADWFDNVAEGVTMT